MSVDRWIAVDWGTTNLRLWLMSSEGEVLSRINSEFGMATLAPYQFESKLLELIDDWLPVDGNALPVIACGMVGAKQGWYEVPYRSVPCVTSPELNKIETFDSRISVSICSGLCQRIPADVMRGEETQIAGLVFNQPDYQGVVCLPGTHSKWAEVCDGQVSSFQSFMTGELFGLLAKQSVLRFTVDTTQWQEDEFKQGIELAMADPASITGRLFALRAQALVQPSEWSGAAARLSGYIIGLELAASRPYWEGRKVSIIAASSLAEHYRSALEQLGQKVEVLSAEEMTLSGLRAAYRTLGENTYV